jgi:hypothetical protein
MDTAKTMRLEIPDEFKIACVVNNLKPAEALQVFINHVSFFQTLNSGYLTGFQEASLVMSEYSVKMNLNGNDLQLKRITDMEGPEFHQAKSVKHIRQLIALTFHRKDSESVKHRKSIPIVKGLFKSIQHFKFCPEKIYLNATQQLVFNNDFRIICELYQIYPKCYLEYFMNKISLAETNARLDLNIEVQCNAMAFFFRMVNGLGQLNTQKIKPGEAILEYIDEIQQLPAKSFIIRNLDERIALYSEFYKSHYRKITKENI